MDVRDGGGGGVTVWQENPFVRNCPNPQVAWGFGVDRGDAAVTQPWKPGLFVFLLTTSAGYRFSHHLFNHSSHES